MKNLNFLELQDQQIGQELHSLCEELFPIHRCITGDGVRQTIKVLNKYVPIEMIEIPTGTKVFDWEIPKEWNINDAYVLNSRGEKIIDYKQCNLSVLNSSSPVNKKVSLEELKQHLHTLPEHPEWIPYRYSHYAENWGFCMPYSKYKLLEEDEYTVVIDSSFKDGSLSYGEILLEGETTDEVLISCHICHPSMANDNLSGISIATKLAQYLKNRKHRYSYRFIFVPATIGSIAWLASNQRALASIKYGLVLSCLGDDNKFTYKKTRHGNFEIDRIMEFILKSEEGVRIKPYFPMGYDERQFNSPGINLPVGLFSRSSYNEYEEYHTSADNLDCIKSNLLFESFKKVLEMFDVIENNGYYMNKLPNGEPNLGRRGLYRMLSGHADTRDAEISTLWLLSYSDGNHSLLDIAELSGINFNNIKAAAQLLVKENLLQPVLVS